ncbi:glycine/D-amino acid oxidase, deaminating, partial [Caulobacter sp. AP07]|uniref:NAD(P)/FAD-dependent oxidoreductase n=1 Tax=Caulobacter sp. AP07 TaxID=1144304 RepID=UPI000271ED67
GGGNIGCMTALSLVERGLRVVLCEKGVIAGEASGRSLGYIDGQFLDPVKIEIVARSKALWADMNRRVGAETGYRRPGLAALFSTPQSVEWAAGWLESAKGAPSIDARMLTAAQAAEMAGGSTESFVGGIYQASDAVAEPQLAASAMAEAFRRRGGVILQGCAARGIEMSAGRVSSVVTEKGAILCGAVVLAGGAWSPVFARSLGLDLPQFMAFSGIARLSPPSGGPSPQIPLVFERSGVIMRPTLSGAYDVCAAIGTTPITPAILGDLPRLLPAFRAMGSQVRPVLNVQTFMDQWRIPKHWKLDEASPFERNRILMPETRHRLLDAVVGDFKAAYPTFGDSRLVETWSGALTSTLDNMPVLSPVSQTPGLFVGSGFYYGLTMAPAAGEALADLVTGAKPSIDLSPYRFSRFSDGSKLEFRG